MFTRIPSPYCGTHRGEVHSLSQDKYIGGKIILAPVPNTPPSFPSSRSELIEFSIFVCLFC